MTFGSYLRIGVACLAQAVVCPAHSADGNRLLTIPPLQTSVDLHGQRVAIAAWAAVTLAPAGALRLDATVDMSDLQPNLVPLLRPQLERSDRCGDRLTLNRAVLAPAAPSAILTAYVHYERFACVKAFGKQVVKRLAGGDGQVEVNLTPAVVADNIRLKAEVVKIDADGSLGELLRSGALGDSIRQKIAAQIESAIQKSADLKSALPAEIGEAAAVRSVSFADGGSGRLWLTLAAEVRLSPGQVRALAKAFAR